LTEPEGTVAQKAGYTKTENSGP